jgi:two-component system, NarL family, response regulator NreC
MSRTRVFLVDDHEVLRQGLRMLLDSRPDIDVVGEYQFGHGVTQAIQAAGGADVIVLDISLPDMSGTQVAAELTAALPGAKIVALTRHGERAYVQQMLQNGASGYVLKQTAAEVLVTAIRAVAEGRTFLDPAIEEKMLERKLSTRETSVLTARETEVLTMVAYGHTNKEIAAVLGIAVKTVETHKTNAMQKLDIGSRADLVRYALAEGWLAR